MKMEGWRESGYLPEKVRLTDGVNAAGGRGVWGGLSPFQGIQFLGVLKYFTIEKFYVMQ